MSKILYQKNWTYFKQLYSIPGLGLNTINFLYKNKGINKLTHPKKVKQRILIKINKDLQSKILRQDLVAAKKKKFKLYYSIRTCKSIRHMKKYPIRGQRTHTNAKTKKRMNVRV